MFHERHYWWTRREYIKQCSTAQNVQDWWLKKPERLEVPYKNHGTSTALVGNIMLGDVFSHGGTEQVCVIGSTVIEVPLRGEPYLSYRIDGDRGGHFYHQDHKDMAEGYFKWLPTTRRLFDLWHDQNGLDSYEFMNRLVTWYDQQQLALDDPDAFGLYFIMETLFGKYWSGEAWVG